MTSVLVTGGTGDLGSTLVARLTGPGRRVRIMSRRPRPATAVGASTEWAQASLETGEGLVAAVDGIECIAHCASTPFGKTRQVDVEGTARLLEAAAMAGVQHLVYISIVGIDQIPFPYYQHKRVAETRVAESDVPWTILRATQFHTLLDRFFGDAFLRFPVGAIPGSFKFQPIETGEVADRVRQLIETGPAGRVDDIGGPEVLEAITMARTWARASGRRRLILPLPLWGAVASGFRQGLNCTPAHRYGSVTWSQWLTRRYGKA